NLIDSFRKCLEENGPTETLKMIVDETDYQNELKEEDADDASERIGNIDELINTLRQFEDDEPEGTLSQFLEDAALVSDLDSADEDTSRVMLMTVHSAKGLEFPRVFLCGMEDGVFPGYMSINSDDPDDIEEERRLAYVAITRAQDVLYISSARARMVRGETQYNPVSRFIKEIPEEMLERGPSGNIIGGRTSYKSSYRSSMPERKIVDDGKPQAPIFKKNARALMASGGLSGSVIQKGAALAGTKPDYEVGDRVMHLKFGEGEVLAIEKGPRDYQVTVNFDNAGQKIMYAAFAKLEKMR
ncbi:MAG: ATP-binding domain-containing protein, partial [Lachnospiraceae bacterium]|nr:ATP-binding domain-containing protein [Lachnospiraceae bacterium]